MNPRYQGFSQDFMWKLLISVTKQSQSGLRRRGVLGLYLFQLIAELILPDIIELSQTIDLAQRELAFA
jgi:hypothetical protein